MIVFDQVTKTFPSGATALSEVAFSIQSGELVAITGASGAGKTTLLRLLIREFTPTRGNITVAEFNLANLSPKDLPKLRRIIGPIFQDFKLLEDRTAAENIAIISELTGETYPSSMSSAKKLLELVKLPQKGDLFPRQLSGGELQRVAIARALALKPKIVFADEPTGNLDPATSKDILKLLTDINAKGATVIVATHDESILGQLNARTLKLESGKLVE